MEPTLSITPALLEEADSEFHQVEFVDVQTLAMRGAQLNIHTDKGANRELRMSEDARAFLGNFVAAPVSYLTKCDEPKLVEAIWNHHITKRGSDINVLKAVVKGEEVKAFTTRSFNGLAPSEIVKACQAAIPDSVLERRFLLNNKNLHFALTSPALYEDFGNNEVLAKSDVHHFSVGVDYNFMGDGSPSIRSFGNRHGCGNIMESTYGVTGKQWRIFTTDPQEVLSKFTEYTRKGFEFIKMTMIPHIRATMETKLPDVSRDLQELLAPHNLPETVQELVYEAYRAEDLGGTMYHFINALTRAANSDRCPIAWIEKLRQIAGKQTVTHDPSAPLRRCDTCHQKVKTQK